VLEAAERARKGGDLDDVAAAAERAVKCLSVYGTIDTLENLRKGGRIGGAQALVGSLLSIKPVIRVTDGVVEEESKQRTRGRALRYLASKLRDAGPVDRMAACGADAPDMDQFLSLLEGVPSAETMLVGEIGPVIGTHAGPGTVGVAWLSRQPG
jgi:DegV family protein with EDD domain